MTGFLFIAIDLKSAQLTIHFAVDIYVGTFPDAAGELYNVLRDPEWAGEEYAPVPILLSVGNGHCLIWHIGVD